MNMSMLANTGLAAAAFVVVALPVLVFAPRKAPWLLVVLALSLLDSFATLLPIIYKPLAVLGHHWNWTGKLLDIAALSVAALVLVGTGRLTRAETGFTLAQAPGFGKVVLFAAVPFLLLIAGLTAAYFGNAKPPSQETLFYEATLPGLAEELSYRGVMLAIFNRMFVGRLNLLGARVGYGALAISVAFGALHGMAFDDTFHIQMDALTMAITGTVGFVLAWFRERTGSLALPIVLHNCVNVILESVPKVL